MTRHLYTCIFLLLALTAAKADDATIKALAAKAEAGDVKAMNDLGTRYYEATGVEADYHKALKYFRMAADRNDATGQLNCGLILCQSYNTDDDIIPPNFREGLDYLYLAHKNGNKDAADAIRAFCSGSAEDWGDYGVAPYMFLNNINASDIRRNEAKLKGLTATSPSANMYLAVLSNHDQNHAQAMAYLQKAWELGCEGKESWQGSEKTDPITGDDADPAMEVYVCDLMGWSYENGLGVTKDLNKAIEWYNKSEWRDGFYPDPGAYVAIYRTAQCHRKLADGKYISELDNESEWLSKLTLWKGEVYYAGEGVPIDYAKAASLFEKVTEAHGSWGFEIFKIDPTTYADACYRLGQIYSAGLGVPRDTEMGQLYFDEALKYGSASALADKLKTLDLRPVR